MNWAITMLRCFGATLIVAAGAGLGRAQEPAQPSVDVRYQSAYEFYKQKNYAQAEALFLSLQAEFPDDFRSELGLADVYLDQGRNKEALDVVRQIEPKDSNSFTRHLALGNVFVRTEKYAEAIAEYQTSLNIGPPGQAADTYFKMGETYRRKGEMDNAIAAHRRWKELTGKASLQLALILDGTGQLEPAEVEYNALLVENPGEPVALNNLAYLWAQRGERLDDALEYALRAEKGLPESPDVTDTVGWIYLKKRMPDQAESHFTKALLNGDGGSNPVYRQHLAAALDMKAAWTPARRELRTLLDTASKSDQLTRLQELLRAAQ